MYLGTVCWQQGKMLHCTALHSCPGTVPSHAAVQLERKKTVEQNKERLSCCKKCCVAVTLRCDCWAAVMLTYCCAVAVHVVRCLSLSHSRARNVTLSPRASGGSRRNRAQQCRSIATARAASYTTWSPIPKEVSQLGLDETHSQRKSTKVLAQ